jgi:hypothetical protein
VTLGHHFAINDPADIETAVLLRLVGVAVTEIALWARRQQARAAANRATWTAWTQLLVAAARAVTQKLLPTSEPGQHPEDRPPSP